MAPVCNYEDCDAIVSDKDPFCRRHSDLNREDRRKKFPSNPVFTKKQRTRTEIKKSRKLGRK